MNDKPAHEIQDMFLNTVRREKLTISIYLMSGVKLTGRIRSFDRYCVILESGSQEQMVFKHAISTLVLPRGSREAAPPDFTARRRSPAPADAPLDSSSHDSDSLPEELPVNRQGQRARPLPSAESHLAGDQPEAPHPKAAVPLDSRKP